jgi:deoxyribonuclease-4
VNRIGPPLGAHVSVAGGVHTAPERGKRIGADVVQIFSKQNTRWMGKALGEEDARALRDESDRTGVRVAAIHCAYLINLGSAKETVRTRSLYALEDEASRAAMLGVPYLVMHPGSCGDDPVEEGISRIASAIRSFGKFPEGVTLLLENTAGQGNSIGRTMGQLRELFDAARRGRVPGQRPPVRVRLRHRDGGGVGRPPRRDEGEKDPSSGPDVAPERLEDGDGQPRRPARAHR